MIDVATLAAADHHLETRDPRLAKLIAAHGPCTLGSRERSPFHVLCTSIINQQLSLKAADTIQARVMQHVGAAAEFTPASLAHADPEALRAAGLSRSKARWLTDIAGRVLEGSFSFEQLATLDDEAAIETLDALPGIGRWTAEMFLIFALGRLDIFALDDVGLRRSLDRLYGKPHNDAAARRCTAKWAPYRSVASWYLWRMVDADEGDWG
ncbi:MAG: DNA-3-methyladenine glycosylase 2 family protein [Nevskiaceae bacterium]|nr:MAG: DNA-3-methyladenine glycosylase 2 family protein [Nevskiaceae bacterium]TBR72107.1 MAG: DNA-3-methyladenine glycosylase 2 family protein [Nevskiaceae bacterium]